MPIEQRFADVLKRTAPRLPNALQQRFGEMLKGEALVGAVSVLMILGSADETTCGLGNDAMTVSVGFMLVSVRSDRSSLRSCDGESGGK